MFLVNCALLKHSGVPRRWEWGGASRPDWHFAVGLPTVPIFSDHLETLVCVPKKEEGLSGQYSVQKKVACIYKVNRLIKYLSQVCFLFLILTNILR